MSILVLLLLSYRCIATINVLWIFLKVPYVGLQCMIVVFPDHTDLLFLCRFQTILLAYISIPQLTTFYSYFYGLLT